jgi:hypothetical protein
MMQLSKGRGRNRALFVVMRRTVSVSCGPDFSINPPSFPIVDGSNLPVCSVSGQIDVLLSAFASTLDSFCFFLADFSGCAMK